MASSGAQSIAIDECMSLENVGAIAQEHHIGFIGNLHVTSVLFEETENAANDVVRCMHEGRPFPGYIFGLGGPITLHIPITTLEEAIQIYRNWP